MTKITGNSFSGETVTLDDTYFENCDFDGCQMVFRGTALFSMVNCRFYGVTWGIEGNAGITVQFLAIMYHQFGPEGRQLVESLLQSIRSGDAIPSHYQQI